MRIVSWNVNGLRSVARNGFWDGVWSLSPDILCLQEIKAEAAQLPEEVQAVPGFTAIFESSRARKGYSGVAMYCRTAPLLVETTLGSEERFDIEGRVIVAHFEEFILANVYFPNGGQGPERLAYKLDFYDAFLERIETLHRETGKPIVFCGDVNTAHEAIDLARPEANEENTGFLPEERAWIDAVIAAGYADVFRMRNDGKAGQYTYWDLKTAARDRNVGWRIDYFFVSNDLLPKVRGAAIHPSVFGSDHCPISLDLDLDR
ncbi:MAG TPA: exodeoxyribonuclease III [Candidatus Paceibacterota bacterium]|nr:exodeoxyribonuclease III [Candidatus Paceibacterota bacterium]